MTLPVSGAISFNNINVELGVSGTTQASLGQASYRTLAGVASGAISMSNFYGKANQFAFTISTSQLNANLRTLAVNAGWNGVSRVVVTVNSGVYIYSNSTGTPGLTINGSFPNGVSLTNNGYIMGMGGAGGSYANNAGAGGPAISLGVNATIVNNSYIGGGGGGGTTVNVIGLGAGTGPGGGGGAGGGNGGAFNGFSSGGGGGSLGASGSNGTVYGWTNGKSVYNIGTGGGGGRIMPGSGGGESTQTAQYGRGGGAGGGGATLGDAGDNGTGGAGGSGGSGGGTGIYWGAGGGGGWGASGGSASGGTPGAGGKAIALNGYTATRSGSGATYGAVS